jgi:tripartite-type tricarboxylate transporter receptor subunit TctC
MAPVGTPGEAVATLNGLFHGAMQTTEVKERLTGLGAQPYTPTNDQFTAELRAEFEKAAKVAKMLGTAK